MISDSAYNKIKEALIIRDPEIISDINEIRLSELLHTSRTPIRDALRRLVQEGLLVKNKRGYSIITVSEEDVKLLYEVRIVLEGFAAELAATRATDEQISRMKDLIDQIENSQDALPLVLAELNGRFHDVVAESSGNKYLWEDLRKIRDKLKIVRITLFTSTERKDLELKEHKKIMEAIVEKDQKKAKRVAEEHQKSASAFAFSRIYMFLN